jgi:hypothetical protein
MAQTTWHRNRWHKRYNFLKEIYDRFGTSDIKYAKKKSNYCMGIEPQLVQIYGFKQIKSIAEWIMKQRSLRKTEYAYDTGTVRMTPEKITLLNEINFQWELKYKRNNVGRHYKTTDIFSKDSPVSHTTVRRHYKEKYWDSDVKGCENPKCILHNKKPTWNGERISIELHHKNGNAEDNRRLNLISLCPNCHSQTDNFNGKAIVYNKSGKRMKRVPKYYNGIKKVYNINGGKYVISNKQATGKNFQGNKRYK